MVQKFYSIRSRSDVTRATAIATVFALFMAFGAYYSGALTHLFYGPKLPPELMGPMPDLDKISRNSSRPPVCRGAVLILC